MLRSSRLLVFCFMLLFSTHTAKAEMILHLYELDDRLTPAEDRGYNLYLNDLLDGFDERITKKYAPIKRNTANFMRDIKSCAFPASVQAISTRLPEAKEMDLLSSKSVDEVSVYVYVSNAQVPPRTIKELEKLRIGHVIGNIGATMIKDKAPYLHAARNNENLMKMLKVGRIEAIVGFHPDIAIAFDDLGYHDLIHSPQLTIFKTTVHFVCHDTPESRKFVNFVNQIIPVMAQDGRAQKYLGKHAEITQHETHVDLQN